MERSDLAVKLRDQFIQCPLEGFHTAFLLAFDVSNNGGKLTDLLDAFSEVVLVLLLHLEGELSQDIVNLSEKVDSVTHVLEVFIGVGQVAVLLDEFFYIGNRL